MPNLNNRIKIVDRDFLVSDSALYCLNLAKENKFTGVRDIYDAIVESWYSVTIQDGIFVSYERVE